MNPLKHIESLVLVAVAVVFSATAITRPPADAASEPTLANNSQMTKVVVSAKRLTPAEKAQQAG